jgi:hypothetical protein
LPRAEESIEQSTDHLPEQKSRSVDFTKGSFDIAADQVSVMLGSSSADIKLKKTVSVAAE